MGTASAQSPEQAPAASGPALELRYSSGVRPHQVELLNQDLVRLDTVTYKDVDGELQRIYKLNEVNAKEMKDWLRLRARVIVHNAHPLDASTIRMVQGDVSYPNPDQMPPAFGGANKEDESEDGDPNVVMSNIGGILYLFGKQTRALVGLEVEGVGLVEVKSPRVGIFRIGGALFAPLSSQFTREDLGNRVHSIFRLSTLFHESRHGDGRGKTMLFSHSVCPPGHDLAGAGGCDQAANGPYRIEALFQAAVREGCTDCTPFENEVLSLLQLDSENRILSPLRAGAPDPDHPALGLCAFMERLGLTPQFCQEAAAPQAVVELDDETESL